MRIGVPSPTIGLMRAALLTICSCFGLGLGLASTTPVANACSCGAGKVWSIQLASIDGEGEPGPEQSFWPEEGFVDPSEILVDVGLVNSEDDPSDGPRVELVLVREGVQ
ncbi:hypothetical protein [Nannocystis radixulma]|uniref:Uncharacterized protein n=1 Tax=Nannocystis radixulma TaxID=2995305 RepID=A0ABT5BKL6_9BACT|nr:hypothetical protein [Nannocystis radixulma]MDC0674238.1 hypothetical protein [Nannocystis radixulma]